MVASLVAKIKGAAVSVLVRVRIFPRTSPEDVRAEAEETRKVKRVEVRRARLEMMAELRAGGLGEREED